MSKTITVFLFLIALFIIIGCNNNSHTALNDFNLTLTQSQPLRINETLEDIELTVINNVQWDSEFIELQLVNHTRHTIIYGEAFTIEFFDGGIWHIISSLKVYYLTFVDIGYILDSGDTDYFTRYLSLRFPDGLISGQYRLRMSISNDIDIPNREQHLHDLVTEFYIE